MADWVLAVERAYVDAATGRGVPEAPIRGEAIGRARAAAGAVASRYLAVGTPRSFGLVVEGGASLDDATLSLEAHRTWFAPTDVRCAGDGAEVLAGTLGGRAVTLAEALACDIVCVHASLVIEPGALRRGTHVNALAPAVALPDELARLATIVHEVPGLGELAAGLVDGRQLDELTIFVLGDARIPLAVLPP
jgi:ornithine cyclodeaminase/alanine dehydrogenase-like protein (mu-crystallin family)